jgi:hypothetical protein
MEMLDFIKRLFNKKKKHHTDDLFLRIKNNSPICRFIVEISVDRDSEKYKNLKSLLEPAENKANLFNFATDIICPDYIIKSEDIISNILNYPISSDRNKELIKFKENVKKYKEFEELLNSSDEILVRFGFKYFVQLPYPLESDYIDKNHIYYDLIINNKENKINKISMELIGLRFEKATMTMLHEVCSYTKQFKTYDEFYDDIIKVIKIKQIV